MYLQLKQNSEEKWKGLPRNVLKRRKNFETDIWAELNGI
jgi:hypothetical protein